MLDREPKKVDEKQPGSTARCLMSSTKECGVMSVRGRGESRWSHACVDGSRFQTREVDPSDALHDC